MNYDNMSDTELADYAIALANQGSLMVRHGVADMVSELRLRTHSKAKGDGMNYDNMNDTELADYAIALANQGSRMVGRGSKLIEEAREAVEELKRRKRNEEIHFACLD